jgi:hypothetical protein
MLDYGDALQLHPRGLQESGHPPYVLREHDSYAKDILRLFSSWKSFICYVYTYDMIV